MYLFFDVETTGLPLKWNAPVGQLDNWPRIVEIGWILTDKEGKEIESETYILKPDDFKIPSSASKIHGITNEIANEKGQDRVEILKRFAEVLNKATVLVAHNVDFDKKVVHAEFMRYKIKSIIHKISMLCTMELTTDYCKLRGRYGYKWPTLEELYKKVFSTPMSSSHSALGDVKACKECFFELVNRGVLIIIGSRVLVNTFIDLDDNDLIQVDDIELDITYEGNFIYVTKVRHHGLKEYRVVRAYKEWYLDEKIDRQIDLLNEKWERNKEKLQNNFYVYSKIVEAEEKTKEAEENIRQLENLLEQVIKVKNKVNWDELKNKEPFKEISPATFLQERLDKITKPIKKEDIPTPREPMQTDKKFCPRTNFIEKYFFKTRFQKKIEESIKDFKKSHLNWEEEKAQIEKQNRDNLYIYEQELMSYNKEVELTKQQNRDEIIEWEKRKEKYYEEQSKFNKIISSKKAGYLKKEPKSIIEYCNLVLKKSKYPNFFPKTYELDYIPAKQLLIVDFCLPQIESLPRTKIVRYVKADDNFKEIRISYTALKQLYSNVVFQVAIRTVHEMLEADVVKAISTVCFNGYVKNKKTECIISYLADKEKFDKLNLKGLDCKEAINNFKGKYTDELTEVEPLIKIQHKTN